MYAHLVVGLDLVDLFKPISRMPNTKTILAKTVENYIQQMGIDAIKRVHSIAIGVSFSPIFLLLFIYYY